METTPPPEPRPAQLESARRESRPPDSGLRENTSLEPVPLDGVGPPPVQGGPDQPQPGAPKRKGANSLVLAIIAPASMILTAPVSMFAMLMTYSDDGSSSRRWVTPLVLFSLPLLFASLALRLAIPALKGSPPGSGERSAAAVALCLSGLVFALALGPALDNLGLF
ncbi:hypothetical protein QF031_000210 [Pseudarthrobacter defluvii]|uniref:hypothetical protein n=1 Tax=Pseudarthrobacter defluvii TaxID=410837 RepID=UPI00278AEAEF|nr:hypothetical protein [Pseudarthrobacter defluvii]MDQ0767461.1 hypothetical protein [Pseudarthrobacter defluvii]